MTQSLTALEYLDNRLGYAVSGQGFIGKFCNDIKEVTHLGTSKSDCEGMLEKFDRGDVTFDEALEYIENYENRQKSSTNLAANIVTGLGSIAVATAAVAGGPISWGAALAYGATSGAVIKTVLKGADRATNDIEGDVLDGKEIVKDAISGATTGATSAVSSNIFKGIKEAKIGLTLANGAKCGVECGVVSGAVSYLTDAALDENIQFNFGDLTKHALTSAAISGTVGTLVGGATYGIENLAGNIGSQASLSVGETIVRDGALSSTRKLLAEGERNIFMSKAA